MIGAHRDNHSGLVAVGSAYVFVRAGGACIWTQQEKLTASDAAANDFFGRAVAISAGTAVIGAEGDDHAAGSNAGSAYVFELCDALACAADLNCDGSVGVPDLLDLLAVWGPNQGHPADLTGDGNVGVADLLELLAAWGPCL